MRRRLRHRRAWQVSRVGRRIRSSGGEPKRDKRASREGWRERARRNGGKRWTWLGFPYGCGLYRDVTQFVLELARTLVLRNLNEQVLRLRRYVGAPIYGDTPISHVTHHR